MDEQPSLAEPIDEFEKRALALSGSIAPGVDAPKADIPKTDMQPNAASPVDDFDQRMSLVSSALAEPAADSGQEASFYEQMGAKGPYSMDEADWAQLQSEKDPYRIAEMDKHVNWALSPEQVKILAQHQRTKDPEVEAALNANEPGFWSGMAWPIVKSAVTGAAKYGWQLVQPSVEAIGAGIAGQDYTPEQQDAAFKSQQEAARAGGAALIETGEGIVEHVSKAAKTGYTWFDRAMEKIGAITPEEADDKFEKRHAITAWDSLNKAKNPSEYARAVEAGRSVASRAVKAFVGDMTPSVDDIVTSQGVSRDEALAIKKDQDEKVAQSAVSDMVADLNKNALVDPDLKSFAGLVLPAGNVFSVLEMGAAGAMKLSSLANAAENAAIRVSLGMTKSEFNAVEAAILARKAEMAAKKAAELGPIGKTATWAADKLDTGGQFLEKALTNIPDPYKGLLSEGLKMGGRAGALGGIGAAYGEITDPEHRWDAAKKGAMLGIGLSLPRIASDLAKGEAALTGRMFQGAALNAESSAITKALLRGGEKIKLSPNWPKTLDAMADFAKSGIATGVRMVPLTIAAGAIEDQTWEELQKSYASGMVYGLGGSWLSKAMGKDAAHAAEMRRQMDFDYQREIKKHSPETQTRMEMLRSYDNEIERRKNNLDWAKSNLEQTVQEVGMDNEFYDEAVKAVKDAQKYYEQAHKASPEERLEYSRHIGEIFSDAARLANGTVRGGRNLNIELLTEAEIQNRLMQRGSSQGITPEFARLAARQRGAYFGTDGTVTLPNGSQVKLFDRNTVVVNLDKLKRRQEYSGRSFAQVFQHEVGHALEGFQEYQDLNSKPREILFGRKVDLNGQTVLEEPGLYSEDNLADMYLDTYTKGKSKAQSESWLKENGLWDWMNNEPNRKEMAETQKEEIIADLNARGLSGGIRYYANSPIQAVVDWVTASHQNNILAQSLRNIAGLGGESPFTPEYTKATFSPEVLELNKRAIQAAKDLNGNFTGTKGPVKPKISRQDILQNEKLRDHYMTGTPMYKEGFLATVYDANGNPVHTTVVQSPGAKEGEWRHVDNGDGTSSMEQARGFGNIPSEISPDITIPVGGTVKVERKIILDQNGKPAENDRKTRKLLSKAKGKMIREALDNTPDVGAPNRMRAVSDDGLTYRGTLTPLQRKAIEDLPETIVPLSIKEKLLSLSDMISKDDGTQFIADYANRIDVNGNYRAFSPKLVRFVPIGLHFSKADNLLVTTISMDGIEDKLDLWKKYMPERLAPWNYDTDRFMEQFNVYMKNWEAGLAEKTDHSNLDPNPAKAEVKKNIFNDLLNIYDKETQAKNPDRTKIPKLLTGRTAEEKLDGLSSDPNTVVRSRRLDSIASLEVHNGPKFRVPYQYAKNNWMAEGAPEATDMPGRPLERDPGSTGIGLGAIGGQKDFYSKAGEVLLTKMPSRASYEQLKNMLDPVRGSGVKPDELKWSGILPYMEQVAQEKGFVSKEDIQKFLNEGYKAKFKTKTASQNDNVSKFEVSYDGESEIFDTYDSAKKAFDEGIRKVYSLIEEENVFYPSESETGEWNVVSSETDKIVSRIRLYDGSFHNFERSYESEQEAQDAIDQSIQADAESMVDFRERRGEDPTQYSQYTIPGGKNYEETILRMPGLDYESKHFDGVPDYVAHMRTADHGTGRLIEEFQSDLHQDARAKDEYDKAVGYRGESDLLPEPDYADIELTKVNLPTGVVRWHSVDKRTGKTINYHYGGLTEDEAFLEAKQYGFYEYQKRNHEEALKPPDAPFKKDWSVQLFKRALTQAVANNKEWIGWTAGVEQIKRYEEAMRQVVDEISWVTAIGRQKAFGALKNGKTVLAGKIKEDGTVYDSAISSANGKKLSEVLGKELALKILAEKSGTATGDDLTIGGEGMKGFYDDILPKELGKYVKQWGGKVEKDFIEKNAAYRLYDGLGVIYDEFKTEKEAKDAMRDMEWEGTGARIEKTAANAPIWRINITPEIRQGVIRGQPLFMAESQEAGKDPYKMSAIHKISEEGLLFADKMGGLSVPSVAVVKAGTGIQGFGNITLVGSRDLGDPKQNPVFSGDAYTQRFPKPQYPAVKRKVAQDMINKFKDVQNKYSSSYADNVTDIIWDNAVNTPNPEEAISKMRRSNVAKAAFLGKEAPEPKVRLVTQDLGILDTQAMKDWMSTHSIRDLDYRDTAARKSLGDAIKGAFDEVFPKSTGLKGERIASRFVDEDGMATVGAISRLEADARNYGKTEIDTYATRTELDNALMGREPEFNAWVEETIQGMYAAPRIRIAGKWEPYTLENIARVMTSGKVSGVEKSMTQSTGLTAAEMAREFGDLNEMRNTAEAPWGIRGETEVNDARSKVSETLRQYRESLLPYHEGSTWNALDDAMASLSRYYKMGAGGERQMRQALSKNGFKNVPQNIIKGALNAYQEMRNAPVKYFESKPQRIVRLDEFKGAIVPDNVDPKVLDALKKNGIEVRTIPSDKADDSAYIGNEISKLKGGQENQEKLGIRFMSELEGQLKPVPTQEELDAMKASLPEYASTVQTTGKWPQGSRLIKIYDVYEGHKDEIGYAYVRPMPEKDALLVESTHLEGNWRNKGYGQALYREIAKFAQEEGISKLTAVSTSRLAANARSRILETKWKGAGWDAESKVPANVRFMAEEHAAAHEAGDEQKARELVDAAAKAAGYKYRAYRGVENNYLKGDGYVFTKADETYFTSDKEYANSYAYGWSSTNSDATVYDVYLRMENPWIPDHINKATDWSYDAEKLKKEGYDGVIGAHGGKAAADKGNLDVAVVFDPSQIKSADPFTYDKQGNLIPLSERFNPGKPDVRFMSEEYAAAHEAGDEKKARGLVRQAAKDAGYTIGPVYHGTYADKFNEFEQGRASAMYFTDNLNYATEYGPNVQEVYLKGNVADLSDPSSEAYKIAVDAFNEAGGWSENEEAMEGRRSPNFDPKKDNTWEIFDNPDTDIGGVLMDAGYDAVKLQERGALPGEDSVVSYAVFNPEQIKSAEPFTYDNQGNLIPLSERFDSRATDIRFMAEDGDKKEEKPRMPMSAVEVLHKDSAILPKPVEKRTNAEIAMQLADVAERYHGMKVTSSNITPEIEQEFVINGTDEAEAALKASGKNAANWYSTAIQAALKVAGVIHSVLTDLKVAMANPLFAREADPLEAANFALRVPLAITSQNMTVPLNARFAEEQFNIFQQTGKFDPSKKYGGKAKSISANLDLANRMIEKLGGILELRKFVDAQFTVRQLEEAASAITGTKVSIAGRKEDLVNGAAIFGPKIGQGFLQNLMGKFTPVTIDLWMRRTWGRWTGDVVGDGVTGVRMGRMIKAFRDYGKQMPDSIKRLKTVVRSTGFTEKGRPTKPELTISENVEDRLESDLDFRQEVERFAKQADSEFQKHYALMSAPMSKKLAAEVRAAMPKDPKAPTEAELAGLDKAYRKVVKEQAKIAESLDSEFSSLTNSEKKALNPVDNTKPIPKDAWIKLRHEQQKRSEKLENPEKNLLKPEWAKAAKVIVAELNPVDIPSEQDRVVISRIVNKIRETLESRGYTVTNADVQAILWYPEKDLWAKLAGKKESNLKQSYDDEFIKIAEQRGLGERARAVAKEVRGY